MALASSTSRPSEALRLTALGCRADAGTSMACQKVQNVIVVRLYFAAQSLAGSEFLGERNYCSDYRMHVLPVHILISVLSRHRLCSANSSRPEKAQFSSRSSCLCQSNEAHQQLAGDSTDQQQQLCVSVYPFWCVFALVASGYPVCVCVSVCVCVIVCVSVSVCACVRVCMCACLSR